MAWEAISGARAVSGQPLNLPKLMLQCFSSAELQRGNMAYSYVTSFSATRWDGVNEA